MKNIQSYAKKCSIILSAAVMLILLPGCGADARRMIPDSVVVTNTFPNTIGVAETVGGQNQAGISNEAYTQALVNALQKFNVFKKVVSPDTAHYQLYVTILSYDRPVVGLNFDITLETRWELSSKCNNKAIWTNTVISTYHASFAEAFIAAERLKKAYEGVARQNIAEGVEKISKLNLK